MPIVSVIVPVYNTMQWLADCVESIRTQTLRDIEIILVDDGSTDYSGVICDAYADMDERIRVIHQENRGVSAARNAGMRIASGKYIMFCDSDDYVAPEWCACAAEMADQHSNAMVCFSFARDDVDRIQEFLYSNTDEYSFFKRGEYSKLFRTYNFGYLSSKIFSKELLKKWKIEFDEDVSYGEDSTFVFTYLRMSDYIVLRNISPLFYHRYWSYRTLSGKFLGKRAFTFFKYEVAVMESFLTKEETVEFYQWAFWNRGIYGLQCVLDTRNPDPTEKQISDCQEIINSSEFKKWCMATVSEDTTDPVLYALRQGNFTTIYKQFLKWLEGRNN